MRRVRLLITGLVQGVFYRASAAEEARRLEVTGYVQNEPDGSVSAIAEGTSGSIVKFIEWAESGPPGAHVREVEVTDEHYKGEFETFEER